MRILICGGGIAGLTLASFLLQKGVTPVIIDKRRKDEVNNGFGLSVWDNGQAILEKLGLKKPFVSKGYPFTYTAFLDKDGHELKTVYQSLYTDQYAPTRFVGRSYVYDLLNKTSNKADIRYQTTIRYITEKESETDIEFSDGKKETFDLIVGSDGIHSYIREEIFQYRSAQYAGWNQWLIRFDDIIQPPQGITHLIGPKAFVVLYPNEDGKCTAYFSLKAKRQTKQISKKEHIQALREHFKDFGWKVPQLLAGLREDHNIHYSNLREINTKKITHKNFVLLGDSTHAMCPLIGIGCSMAMEDAYTLFDELEKTNFDTKQIPCVLEKHKQRRIPRIKTIKGVIRFMKFWIRISSKWQYYAKKCLLRFIPNFVAHKFFYLRNCLKILSYKL